MSEPNPQNEFEAHLDTFLASFQPSPETLANRQKANAQRDEFIRRFPLDSIPNLTLEQYCIGKGDRENFCWWVERGTKLYNSYFPGSSASYGVWYSKNPGKNRKWYGPDGKGYGKTLQVQAYLKEHTDATDEDALREVILKPLHAFLSSRGMDKPSTIQHLMIGRGFILKLLNLYFPEDYIVINSDKWIQKILIAIGEDPKVDVFEGNRIIQQFFNRKKAQFPDNDFSRYDFTAFLEKELKLKEKEQSNNDNPETTRKETSMNQHLPLNTILYGPPGTGKTFNALVYAVAIIEDKTIETVRVEAENNYAEVKNRFDRYKEQGRIAFTTFHQSYGYEDFVEGIRPVLENENKEKSKGLLLDDSDDQSNGLSYRHHDGVFKQFCDDVSGKKEEFSGNKGDINGLNEDCSDHPSPLLKETRETGLGRLNPKIWVMWLGATCGSGSKTKVEDAKVFHQICFDQGYICMGYNPNILGSISTQADRQNVNSLKEMRVGDIVLSCFSTHEIDAIGIVKGEEVYIEDEDDNSDWPMRREVKWLASGIRLDLRSAFGSLKQLPRTTINGYIKGDAQIKWDKLNNLLMSELNGKALREYPRNRIENDDHGSLPNYVFIIDEINRGNISKIFGELITLIEPNKRLGADEETKAILPYSGEEFGVPKNVYILGTMNTADRSIALLDTALRRRFDFVEMMPQPDKLEDIEVEETGIDLPKMLQTINDRIEFLLDREHTIGHAYFMGDFQAHPTLDALADIFRNKVVPLLQEYFFDDYSKIRLVLGDNAKPKENQFVQEVANHASLFAGTPADIDLDKPTYKINPNAFGRAESYIGIYA